jgi:long-chain acyl-CoA synthetase
MLDEADLAFDKVVAALTGPGAQFEVGEAIIRGNNYPVFAKAPPSLWLMVSHLTQMHSDKTFLVYEGERYSFAQVHRHSVALAAHLQSAYGVQKGDPVVIAMRNYPEWVFAFLAVISIGGIAVPLNAWWQPEELAYALTDSGAKLAICDEARAQRFNTLPHGQRPRMLVARPEDYLPDGMEPLTEAILASSAQPTPVAIDHEDDATILYTSGSTGTPKGAVSTHRAIVSALMNLAVTGISQMQLDAMAGTGAPATVQPATLLSIPLFHVTGSHAIFLVSYLVGRKLVMLHKWDATTALQTIQDEQVTYFVGVPTMTLELMQHPDRDSYDLSTLVDLGAGGAARPAEHVARLVEAFPGKRPGIGYGLTETNAVGCINGRAGYLKRPASTGRASRPLVQLRIAADDGSELAQGAVGEVWLRTAALFRGYWNKPVETANAITAEGWFKSGDLGYVDEDGYLFIVDRKKDIIIRGGENISCLEVEGALYAHDGVAEASVFGLPDERLGELVGAVVFFKPGAGVAAADVLDHARAHLAAFKVPAQLWVSSEPLPRLGSGKIDKVSLRAAYRELYARAA